MSATVAYGRDAANLAALEVLATGTFALWPMPWSGFSWRAYYRNHTVRVRRLADRLAAEEGGDRTVLSYAALLHDITKCYDGDILRDGDGQRIVDRNGLWRCVPEFPPPDRANRVTRLYDELGLHGQPHHKSGARIAEELLGRLGLPDELVTAVSSAISHHVRPPGAAATEAYPLESQILFDADTVDANMGLVAFYRNIQIHAHRTPEWTLADYLAYLPQWNRMKRPLVQGMTTRAGRRVATERHRFNCQVTQWLQEEHAGERGAGAACFAPLLLHFVAGNANPDLDRDRRHINRTWLHTNRGLPRARSFCRQLNREVLGRA